MAPVGERKTKHVPYSALALQGGPFTPRCNFCVALEPHLDRQLAQHLGPWEGKRMDRARHNIQPEVLSLWVQTKTKTAHHNPWHLRCFAPHVALTRPPLSRFALHSSLRQTQRLSGLRLFL